MRFLLDLDDVLVDFVGGICEAHGRPSPYDPLTPKCAGCYDMASLWGMSVDEFRRPFKSYAFWRALPPTEWCFDLVGLLESHVGRENVCLLSNPSGYGAAVEGKMGWIAEHLPAYAERWLLGRPKHFCASLGSVLVDDMDRNAIEFSEAGGGVILFPRPWNHHYEISGDPMSYVRWVLEDLETGLEELEGDHANI